MNQFEQRRAQSGNGIIFNPLLNPLYERVAKGVLERRPRPLRKFMRRGRGKEKIKKLSVCRVPVTKAIQRLLNALQFGRYNRTIRKLNYEDVFHLYLVIEYENGETYIMEKNQRVIIRKINNNVLQRKGVQCKSVNMSRPYSINNLITRAENNNQGTFYRYSANNQNCQKFVLDILTSSNLITPELKTFIYQDAEQLLPKGVIRSIAQRATDIGGFFDTIIHGGEYI